jgi:hypothetical protein
MSIRNQIMWAVPLWLVASLTVAWLAIQVSAFFLIPLLLLLISFGAFITTRKCPHCGKPVLYNAIMPGAAPMWTGEPPRNCTRCGWPLT